MPNDRMFHVIVLGGIAIVGTAPSCGARTTEADSGTMRDAPGDFPSEVPAFFAAGWADDAADASADTTFPFELPPKM